MTPQLRNLLILLAGIAVILLLVIILFGNKSPLMRFLSFFLEEDDSPAPKGRNSRTKAQRRTPSHSPNAQQSDGSDDAAQKKSNEPVVEMATLIQRSDDRLRVIENSGKIRMIDEYYELMFLTRKGAKIKVECSPDIYEKIPFDEQGSLTYKKGTFVKFKLYSETYYNDGTVEDNARLEVRG